MGVCVLVCVCVCVGLNCYKQTIEISCWAEKTNKTTTKTTSTTENKNKQKAIVITTHFCAYSNVMYCNVKSIYKALVTLNVSPKRTI